MKPWLDGPQWPMVFDTSMGARRDDAKPKEKLDRFIEQRRGKIDALLDAYDVPRAPDLNSAPQS